MRNRDLLLLIASLTCAWREQRLLAEASLLNFGRCRDRRSAGHLVRNGGGSSRCGGSAETSPAKQQQSQHQEEQQQPAGQDSSMARGSWSFDESLSGNMHDWQKESSLESATGETAGASASRVSVMSMRPCMCDINASMSETCFQPGKSSHIHIQVTGWCL